MIILKGAIARSPNARKTKKTTKTVKMNLYTVGQLVPRKRVDKPSQHHQGSAIARPAKLISLDLQKYFREICKNFAIARIPKCRKEPAHASPRTRRQGITVTLSPRNASAMKTLKAVCQHQDGRGEEAPSPDHQKNARLMKSVPYVSLGATTAVRT